MDKSIINSAVILILLIASCTSDPNHPGYEYMPDMAHSVAYETYGENSNFDDGSNALLPVNGTIPRGHMLYSYEKTKEGFELSASLKNPLTLNNEVLAEGQRLYTIYCSPCHGIEGKADGLVVTKGGFAVPPLYTDTSASMTKHNIKKMTEGQIYHTIMVGSTIMGSYASQLAESERWKIVSYVQSLQGPGEEIKTEGITNSGGR